MKGQWRKLPPAVLLLVAGLLPLTARAQGETYSLIENFSYHQAGAVPDGLVEGAVGGNQLMSMVSHPNWAGMRPLQINGTFYGFDVQCSSKNGRAYAGVDGGQNWYLIFDDVAYLLPLTIGEQVLAVNGHGDTLVAAANGNLSVQPLTGNRISLPFARTAAYSTPWEINEVRTVVGMDNFQPVLIRGGVLQSLVPPSGQQISFATLTGVDEAGEAVGIGYFYPEAAYHPFLVAANNTLTILPTGNLVSASPQSISPDGSVIVGGGADANRQSVQVIWRKQSNGQYAVSLLSDLYTVPADYTFFDPTSVTVAADGTIQVAGSANYALSPLIQIAAAWLLTITPPPAPPTPPTPPVQPQEPVQRTDGFYAFPGDKLEVWSSTSGATTSLWSVGAGDAIGVYFVAENGGERSSLVTNAVAVLTWTSGPALQHDITVTFSADNVASATFSAQVNSMGWTTLTYDPGDRLLCGLLGGNVFSVDEYAALQPVDNGDGTTSITFPLGDLGAGQSAAKFVRDQLRLSSATGQ